MSQDTYSGATVIECPNCIAMGESFDDGGVNEMGTVSTNDAEVALQIPNGVRYLGVPCKRCGKTYTIEITRPAGAK